MIDVRLRQDTNRGVRRWVAAWTDPVTGQSRRKLIGPQTKVSRREAAAEVSRLGLELNGEHGLLASAPDGGESLADLVDSYLLERKADAAPGTLELFRTTGDKLEAFFGRDMKVRSIEAGDARRWRANLAESLSDLTVRKHVRNAKQLWKHAMHVSRRWAVLNPFDGLPSSVYVPDEKRDYVSPDDLESLLAVAAERPAHRRLLALCRLAGVRLGEALRLRWDEIDWDQRTLTVTNPGRRATTKKRGRVVPLEPWLVEILAADWTDADSELVCPMTKNQATAWTRAVMVATGIRYRQMHHALRGSLETDWLARYETMSVCAWLGHAPAIAQMHYHRPELLMGQVTGKATRRIEGPIRPSSWSPPQSASPVH